MFNQNNDENTTQWRNTNTFRYIQMVFHPKVTIHELVSFVDSVTVVNPNLRLIRKEKRSGHELINWFENNWDQIQPYFHTFNINNENFLDQLLPDNDPFDEINQNYDLDFFD